MNSVSWDSERLISALEIIRKQRASERLQSQGCFLFNLISHHQKGNLQSSFPQNAVLWRLLGYFYVSPDVEGSLQPRTVIDKLNQIQIDCPVPPAWLCRLVSYWFSLSLSPSLCNTRLQPFPTFGSFIYLPLVPHRGVWQHDGDTPG